MAGNFGGLLKICHLAEFTLAVEPVLAIMIFIAKWLIECARNLTGPWARRNHWLNATEIFVMLNLDILWSFWQMKYWWIALKTANLPKYIPCQNFRPYSSCTAIHVCLHSQLVYSVQRNLHTPCGICRVTMCMVWKFSKMHTSFSCSYVSRRWTPREVSFSTREPMAHCGCLYIRMYV